jgi:hypothetical protein
MKTIDIRARILAAIAGVALLFFVAFVAELRPGTPLLILFIFFIGTYSIAGILLGFIWPDSGWRLGGYLFAIWPLFLLVAFLFSDPPPVIHWKQELTGLFAYLVILPGAAFGAWAGSRIRRYVSGDKSVAVKHPLSGP